MPVELKVPEVGESISEVEIGQWLKPEGEFVNQDEPVVELESEKATIELPAPIAGIVTKILKQPGETASVGEVIGAMEESAAPAKAEGAERASAVASTAEAEPERSRQTTTAVEVAPTEEAPPPEPPRKTARRQQSGVRVMPAAQRVLAENGVDPSAVEATGPGGRVLKEDALRHLKEKEAAELAVGASQGTIAPSAADEAAVTGPAPQRSQSVAPIGPREEKVVRMSPMRRTIASRLVEAQHTAALLTTFNEVDMSGVKRVRAELQEEFQVRHGVKLGFMSFFVRAVVHALREYPQVNAQIRGEDIVYYNYCDVGIAVGAGKGLVVPVLRNAERLSFAEIERTINDFAARAQENKVTMEELQGGTFTISNGGVYGSLLSTPIINPPQSGVLGMHAIQDRPVAVDGEVVIRPMMYVALTYDHRIVDGREAVAFLKTIKERIEKPSLLFDL